MKKPSVIHIVGASGAGTSTLDKLWNGNMAINGWTQCDPSPCMNDG